MDRLPFNASKTAAAAAAEQLRHAERGGTHALSISQLASAIESSLRAGFPASVRVIGEVSGFRDRTHWYFDLKDANAVVNCVMFQSAARKARFTPIIGHEVIATGRIEFYAKGGKVTLIIEKLEPVGAGALELAFKKLCEELRTLGWFAPERKRPIPAFPRRVAVVTSKSGAAWQDVLNTFQRRCRAVQLVLVDALMQGDKAAPDVANAIGFINERAAASRIDAILLTRGGGSAEDLWAFNERIVAEAILNSSIPVVAAIGHETDTTIAELVADERCATPTQAAMRLSPDAEALMEQLDAFARRLRGVTDRHVKHDKERLRGVARHPLFSNPRELVRRAMDRLRTLADSLNTALRARVSESRHRLARNAASLHAKRPSSLHAKTVARLDAAETNLRRALNITIERRREKVEARTRQLTAVGPLRVLARGYSCTLREDGRVVTSPTDVRDGDLLRTVVAEGSIRSVVGDHAPTASTTRKIVDRVSTSTPPPHRAVSSRSNRSSQDQPGLF